MDGNDIQNYRPQNQKQNAPAFGVLARDVLVSPTKNEGKASDSKGNGTVPGRERKGTQDRE